MSEYENNEVTEKTEQFSRSDHEAFNLIGNEPIWTDTLVTDQDYSTKYHNALNWANYVYDDVYFKKQTKIYYLHHAIDFAAVENAKDWRFNIIGKLCWLVNNNCPLKDSSRNFLNKKIKELELNATEDAKMEDIEDDVTKKMKKSELKEIMNSNKSNNLIAAIDDAIDNMAIYDDEADIYKLLNDQEIESYTAKEAKAHYDMQQTIITNELKDIKKDSSLDEEELSVYSEELVRHLGAIEHIRWQIGSYIGNNKATRTSKIKRSKVLTSKIEKATKDVQFKTHDSTYKVQSIPLDRIVGMQLLLTFNTKTRDLGMYFASDSEGLQIKGTTILNYDEKKSVQKKLRQPEKVLSHLQQNSDRRANVLFNGLSTKADLPNGRLNKYTILLKAFKTLSK